MSSRAVCSQAVAAHSLPASEPWRPRRDGDRGQGSERLACDAFSWFTGSSLAAFMTTGGGTSVGLPAVERNVMTQNKDRSVNRTN
jgi:hypothetical protein